MKSNTTFNLLTLSFFALQLSFWINKETVSTIDVLLSVTLYLTVYLDHLRSKVQLLVDTFIESEEQENVEEK